MHDYEERVGFYDGGSWSYKRKGLGLYEGGAGL